MCHRGKWKDTQINRTEQRTQEQTHTNMSNGLLTKVQKLFNGKKTGYLTNGAGACLLSEGQICPAARLQRPQVRVPVAHARTHEGKAKWSERAQEQPCCRESRERCLCLWSLNSGSLMGKHRPLGSSLLRVRILGCQLPLLGEELAWREG